MTTKADLITWLKSPSSRRCILAEVVVNVAGTETTRYMSDRGYVTSPTDSPSNIVYEPILSGNVTFSESVELDGTTGISYGDIELFNESGVRDSWLNDVWQNRTIKLFIGDMSWARAQFYPIFNGIVYQLNSAQEDRLNIKIGDKLQLLNTQVSSILLGGSSSNKDKLIPLVFGEVFNITPLLTNSATLEYQVHNGPIELIIEVRDNGVPVAFTPSLSTGKFTLAAAPFGTVTCSVQGDKPSTYVNDIANLIKRLVESYGVTPFADADIDLTNFAAFSTAHQQAVGVYLDQPANVLQVIQELAGSIGAHVVMGRDGLLRLVQLSYPATSPNTSITGRGMLFKTFGVSNRYTVQAGQLLSFCINYTVQSDLLTGIPQANKTLFSQDVQYVSANSPATASLYKLTTNPTAQATNLLSFSDAQNECNRRLNIFNVQRTSYTFTGVSHLLVLSLGDCVTVTHPRFGFINGKNGLVTSMKTDWLSGTVEVEVTL